MIWCGQIHYSGDWKGWALKIETYLGSEMATSEAISTSGSGIRIRDGKNIETVSGMNSLDLIFENLYKLFGLTVFGADPGSCQPWIQDRNGKNFIRYTWSGINIPDPQHCLWGKNLRTFLFIQNFHVAKLLVHWNPPRLAII